MREVKTDNMLLLLRRVEIKNLGGGRHQLIFNKAEIGDSGDIVCSSGRLTSSCKFTVGKGEEAPVINMESNKVEGPISKPLVFHVPYTGEYIKFHLQNLHACIV